MVYKASMDLLSKIVTVAVTILFGCIIFNLYPWMDGTDSGYIAVLLVLVYVIAYLFRPLDYTLTDTDLLIRRPIGVIKVPRAAVVSIVPIQRRRLFGAIRLFGVGAFFGYYGTFYTSSIGRMTWYMTNMGKAVLLTTIAKRSILISPDLKEAFVDAFERKDTVKTQQ